jgi:hypothetical protein
MWQLLGNSTMTGPGGWQIIFEPELHLGLMSSYRALLPGGANGCRDCLTGRISPPPPIGFAKFNPLDRCPGSWKKFSRSGSN